MGHTHSLSHSITKQRYRLSLSLSLSAHHHQALCTLYTRARLKNERVIPRTVRSFMSSRSAEEEEGRRRRRERHVYVPPTDDSRAARVRFEPRGDRFERRGRGKGVKARAEANVRRRARGTNNHSVRYRAPSVRLDEERRRRKEELFQEVCDVRDVSRGDVFVVVRR